MHYTREYKNDEEAIEACKEYWGQERFATIYRSILRYYKEPHDKITPEQADNGIHLAISLAGVEGFPVYALIRKAKHELGLLCYWPLSA